MKPVLTRPEIRRDAVRVLRAAAADTRFLLAAAERLPDFSRPALGVWASQDRVMPPGTARRLAKLLLLGEDRQSHHIGPGQKGGSGCDDGKARGEPSLASG